MKNPMEVLRAKQADISRVQKEIEALRVTAKLLGDKNDALDNHHSEPGTPPQPQANWRVPRDSSTS